MAPVGNNPPLDQVIDTMLQDLTQYLPPAIAGLPDPSVSVASVNERPVGLNNRIGTEARGPFPIVAVKGIRLDALIRFQAWASSPTLVDSAFTHLETQLLADRDSLRGKGFLRLALEATGTAEQVPSLDTWRKQADYRILFEYPFQDSDGAGGLIARIQIDSVPEESNLLPHEITTVTDKMARWDNLSAPPFVVRGRFSVGGLAALQFVSSADPSGTVTLTRTAD